MLVEVHNGSLDVNFTNKLF